VSVWLTDLADILRGAGVPVIEETYKYGPHKGKSWKDVGYNGAGLQTFSYILWHHDASPAGPSPGVLDWVMYDGFGAAPAAACWVCQGCNGAHAPSWHVYAAGLSNHAGTGGPWNPNTGDPYVPQNAMNMHSLGIEVDHNYGESWGGNLKQTQLDTLRLGTAAILKADNIPTTRVQRHLDWTNGVIDGNPRFVTYGRKNDIDGLDLGYERKLLGELIAGLGGEPSQAAKIARIRDRIAHLREKRQAAKAAGQPTDGIGARIKRLREKLRNLL